MPPPKIPVLYLLTQDNYEVTGEIIKNNEEKDEALYDFTMIGLEADREILYKNLDHRVEEMFINGLINEVKGLKNYSKTKSLIGYKETIMYLDGELSLDEAKELIKKSTRNYAKRQMTWYRHQFDNINWFKTDYEDFNNTINEVDNFLKI